MRRPRPLTLLLLLPALAWSGWFLRIAWRKFLNELRCASECPVFMPVEFIEQHRRAMDWQTPLMLAVLPLVLLMTWLIWRTARGRFPTPRSGES
jgi:hypothetical protein